eukprot:15896-Heterococcus_DN1.PRE.1
MVQRASTVFMSSEHKQQRVHAQDACSRQHHTQLKLLPQTGVGACKHAQTPQQLALITLMITLMIKVRSMGSCCDSRAAR